MHGKHILGIQFLACNEQQVECSVLHDSTFRDLSNIQVTVFNLDTVTAVGEPTVYSTADAITNFACSPRPLHKFESIRNVVSDQLDYLVRSPPTEASAAQETCSAHGKCRTPHP